MTPYTAKCEKFGGGVVSIDLIEVEGLHSAIFDHSTGCFTHFECLKGYSFVTITPPEESSTYTQTLLMVNGTTSYCHTLTLELQGFEPSTQELVQRLSQKGVVAIIQTHNRRVVVGYCAPYQMAVPLLIETCVASSKQRLSQRESQSITLQCSEPFGAKPYKPKI